MHTHFLSLSLNFSHVYKAHFVLPNYKLFSHQEPIQEKEPEWEDEPSSVIHAQASNFAAIIKSKKNVLVLFMFNFFVWIINFKFLIFSIKKGVFLCTM